MAFNLGVNLVEVDGRAVPTITAAPVSVAGLLVRSERGVPNLPVLVRGFSDFTTNFGRFIPTAVGAHAARGFFENGGTQAYVVRVVGANSNPASVVLNDRAAAAVATLQVTAGRRGRLDPGAWGNALAAAIVDHPRGTSAIPAQVAGANTEPFALADGQTLQVTVNGAAAPVTVTFHAADFASIAAASAAEVAAEINRQTTGVRAGVTPDRRILLASPAPGPASRLVVAGSSATNLGFTGGTANSDAGLAAGTLLAAVESTGGFLPGSAARLESRGHVIGAGAMAATLADGSGIVVTPDGGATVPVVFHNSDWVNPAAITPGEVVAAINRQAQGFTAALTQNNRLVLLSNTYGPASTIAVGPGAVDATAGLGLTAAPVAGARQFRAIAMVSEASRWVSWTGGLALPANAARLQSVEFDLVVHRGGLEVERFESLSMQPELDYNAVAVINDPDRGSRFVTVADQASASGPGLNAPAAGFFPLGATAPTAGADGDDPASTDYAGDPSLRTGLYAFDPVSIQLLGCPDTTAPAVVSASLAYCERRGDCTFVGAPPRGLDIDGIKVYASAFRARKVYGALYAPHIQILNPLDTTGANPRLTINPVGHVLGTYARIAGARGVWKAPAGDEATLRGALGVEFDMTDTEHTDMVKNGGVNGIRAVAGSGIVVDASRSLSTDTRWLFIGTRRLFNFVKSSLRDGLRWVAQEPHDEALRRAVRFNVITPFLLGLWRQGAFGSDPPELVFTVKCDAENNPAADVNQGIFRVEVYFYPVKPAETIILIVGQQESGATTSEA